MPMPSARKHTVPFMLSRLEALEKLIAIHTQQLNTLKNDRRYVKQQLGQAFDQKTVTAKNQQTLIKQNTCIQCNGTRLVKLTRQGPKCLACRRIERLETGV